VLQGEEMKTAKESEEKIWSCNQKIKRRRIEKLSLDFSFVRASRRSHS
jgi:hypothetical protein